MAVSNIDHSHRSTLGAAGGTGLPLTDPKATRLPDCAQPHFVDSSVPKDIRVVLSMRSDRCDLHGLCSCTICRMVNPKASSVLHHLSKFSAAGKHWYLLAVASNYKSADIDRAASQWLMSERHSRCGGWKALFRRHLVAPRSNDQCRAAWIGRGRSSATIR